MGFGFSVLHPLSIPVHYIFNIYYFFYDHTDDSYFDIYILSYRIRINLRNVELYKKNQSA